MNLNPTFEKSVVYPGLTIIRDTQARRVVAYVHKHPYEKYWFWFVGIKISDKFYETEDLCIDAAIRDYYMRNMDDKAIKAGTFNNENLTLGR